jgi:hypothetical protein
MKSSIKADEVRRRIPEGFELPAHFADFIRAKPPYRIEWNDLDIYDLKPSAAESAVPFINLPDGAVVALWYHAASPAVVHIGAHGERGVVARDFEDFLKGLAAGSCGVPDLDGDGPFRVAGITGKARKPPAALQKKFEAWFKKHSALLEPLNTQETESLRQRVHEIAKSMIRDGLSKVYTLSSTWWSMDFQIKCTKANLTISYLDFGAWYPVPDKYKLEQEVVELLKLVKDTGRRHYELSTCSPGIVSIDRDRQLVLVPPGMTDEN